MSEIRKVIILNGAGRSGTTYVSRLLFRHPDVYTLTNFHSKYPQFPVIMTLLGLFSLKMGLKGKLSLSLLRPIIFGIIG